MSTYFIRIMQEVIFKKKVSKGSRFNQVYIPKEMEKKIMVGDLVEVKLLKKHLDIYYHNQKRLSEFKEYLAKNIFSELMQFNGIKNAFIVGSFLYETTYNDIDIVVISGKENKKIEQILTERFNQKFHIICFSEEKLRLLIEKDPIIRSMFSQYLSGTKINLNYKSCVDKNHIQFLLMMPEDLLEIELSSKIYYDNLRRLKTIRLFLENKSLDNPQIMGEMKKGIDKSLLRKIKNNGEINKEELKKIRNIIKNDTKWVKKTI